MEELIPRREPKYEIILESEEKVTLVKEIADPVENEDRWNVPDSAGKDPSVNEKQRKHGRRKQHENKTKKRRIGLINSGATNKYINTIWNTLHFSLFFLLHFSLVLTMKL